jgi:hypothetical protein
MWMVDRNRVGLSPSFTAAAAAPSPSSTSFYSCDLRAVTSASSDTAKRPLRTINANMYGNLHEQDPKGERWRSGAYSALSTPACSSASTAKPSAMR